jgi:acetolactate synthase small subunit
MVVWLMYQGCVDTGWNADSLPVLMTETDDLSRQLVRLRGTCEAIKEAGVEEILHKEVTAVV